jgi:hypothetical protein
MHPIDEFGGRKGANGRFEKRFRLAIAFEQLFKRFRMREVQPAAPGQQELAGRGRHLVVNGDGSAALGQHLGGHEACRTGADDFNGF